MRVVAVEVEGLLEKAVAREKGVENNKHNLRSFSMSRANFQAERKADYELHEKAVSAAYTVRTGTTAQTGLIDNPVNVDVADDFTLTVGSGQYIGQELVIVCSARTEGKTCSISVTNHEASDPEVLVMNAVDEYWFGMWTGSEWIDVSMTVTTS